jgi:hypothetical protein
MTNNFNGGTSFHGGTPVEEMTTLFQPDSLLPVQYFENFRRKVQTEPEKRLLLAVLEDALAAYQKHFSSRGGRGMKLICEVVGFDPQYIRSGLVKWREMKLEELSRMAFEEPAPKIKRLKIPQPRRIERPRMIGLRF